MPPSSQHEARHRIFQEHKDLIAECLSNILGVPMPEPSEVAVLSVDLTETKPLERQADTVLQVRFPAGSSRRDFILVGESQTKPDEERRKRWPYYIAFLADKYDCPVVLLVVCSSKKTAEWAREAIVVGIPGLRCMIVTPVALGPDNVPIVATIAEASRNVPLAVFSALTHSLTPEASGILEALAAALGTIDIDTANYLADFLEDGLGDTAAQRKWKALMATVTHPYVSEHKRKAQAEGRAEGLAEGRTEGLAASIIRVLEQRGVEVDDASRQRIEACGDAEMLVSWLDRSINATQVGEIFA